MRAVQMEKEEADKWVQTREQKIQTAQAKIMKKHATELKSFQQKIQIQVDEHKKARAKELEE